MNDTYHEISKDNIVVDDNEALPTISATYVNYYQNVKKLIVFIKGYFDDETSKTYTKKEYHDFIKTIIVLLGDIVDDVIANDYKLWRVSLASPSCSVNDEKDVYKFNKSIVDDLISIRDELKDDFDHHDNTIELIQDLSVYLESLLNETTHQNETHQ
ncbi:hypothetical protein [Perigonia lusca single nucleopolyhedrovirus]|uniref:Uncharacterized protein n=1 Tax=Perigonia lusca single nucleopolyhedrovirus TaxID=1675865 RepID=A0A0M3WP08_9ABAC|nr:hypothetical protein [Perigonia lusca single nucleopolyhedrovirus]AKN80677.1 hypothetical protein [Perigonia lusca single nucleopolyhedrovirus]